jgi:hypothetical protein
VIRTYRLNPCDCLFAAFDHRLKQLGYRGSRMMLVLDLEGTLDRARLVRGLERAMEAHPWTMGRLWISRLRAWPYWRYEGRPVAPAFTHYDLTCEADWSGKLEPLTEAFFGSGPVDGAPPQVRLAHLEGPDNHHRVCMVYPHALSDVEGAQHFLTEISRLAAEKPEPRPGTLADDDERIDPLAGHGLVQRLRMLRDLKRVMPPWTKLGGISLLDSLPARPVESRRERLLHRIWSGERMERLRENARKVAPSGPGLHSRYVAGCVLRANWRIHEEHGRKLPYFGTTFPVHVEGIERRAVIGNFLVSATLAVGPDRIADRRAVAEDIARQFTAFHDQRQDLWYWSLLWMSGELRTWQYRMFMDWASRSQPFASGYSFYGEIDPPIREFAGARVTNFWVPALISVPPGWNPLFCRSGDQINFMVVWPEGSFPEAVVHRYADVIEDEVFGG